MSSVELFRGAASEWDAFISTQELATASHLYGWKRVIERVYQHECPYLITREGDRITGALPLADVRSLPFGRFLVSLPFLNAGGPLGSAAAIAQLNEHALELAAARQADLLEFRCLQPLALNLPCSQEKISCVLPLPATVAEAWSALGSKLRSQIRRPQKAEIVVRFGADQLQPFFQVFARNMRDLGSPTHPKRFFEAMQEELGDVVRFACAYHGSIPVAAGCGVAWRNELEITWASSLRGYNSLAPNMLLYWAFIEHAIQNRFTSFNFGRCTEGSGSHRFKLQWGAADQPLFWYRSTERLPTIVRGRDGELPLAARVWQRVPVPVANWLGSRLRGGIPA